MFDLIPQPYWQVLLALLLGAILGMQREYTGKAAGLRTYSLVAVGAALFTIISRGGFNEFLVDASRYDPSRIASNVVVGIGFLGAGVVILRGVRIEGLTTAAGLWVSAGIGMAVGVQMYGVAIFTTALVFLILEVLGKFDIEEWLLHKRRRL